jgi:hypothetical protein
MPRLNMPCWEWRQWPGVETGRKMASFMRRALPTADGREILGLTICPAGRF